MGQKIAHISFLLWWCW